MNLKQYQLKEARERREQMNRNKGDSIVFWIVVAVCLCTIAYVVTHDKRMQDVPARVAK